MVSVAADLPIKSCYVNHQPRCHRACGSPAPKLGSKAQFFRAAAGQGASCLSFELNCPRRGQLKQEARGPTNLSPWACRLDNLGCVALLVSSVEWCPWHRRLQESWGITYEMLVNIVLGLYLSPKESQFSFTHRHHMWSLLVRLSGHLFSSWVKKCTFLLRNHMPSHVSVE